MRQVRIREARSGLDTSFALLEAQTPACSAFLWQFLEEKREIPGIHAMWTGPEISCPIPAALLAGADYRKPLPPENITIMPLPGDLVLTYVAPYASRGTPDPVYDIGFFYGNGARLLFPTGWIAGSVVGRCAQDGVAALASACAAIRRNGTCKLEFDRIDS